MGNTESNVTSGVKKQADTSSIKIYKLVGLKGRWLKIVKIVNDLDIFSSNKFKFFPP